MDQADLDPAIKAKLSTFFFSYGVGATLTFLAASLAYVDRSGVVRASRWCSPAWPL